MLRGLVARGIAPDTYRCSLARPEIERRVRDLSRRYADAKHAVINLVFSRPAGSACGMAHAFSDAKTTKTTSLIGVLLGVLEKCPP